MGYISRNKNSPCLVCCSRTRPNYKCSPQKCKISPHQPEPRLLERHLMCEFSLFFSPSDMVRNGSINPHSLFFIELSLSLSDESWESLLSLTPAVTHCEVFSHSQRPRSVSAQPGGVRLCVSLCISIDIFAC